MLIEQIINAKLIEGVWTPWWYMYRTSKKLVIFMTKQKFPRKIFERIIIYC